MEERIIETVATEVAEEAVATAVETGLVEVAKHSGKEIANKMVGYGIVGLAAVGVGAIGFAGYKGVKKLVKNVKAKKAVKEAMKANDEEVIVEVEEVTEE